MQDYINNTTVTLNNDGNVVNESTTSTENTTSVQQVNEKTECECSKNAQHFPTVVMDNKYDTTIETMYNLLYNSSFMSKFLCEVEKSTGNKFSNLL
jgi:hypothetical protein